MNSIVTASLLSLALLFPAAAQERTDLIPPTPQQTPSTRAEREAMDELNAAATAYQQGHFAEAQLRSEKAFALFPASKTAPRFIARAAHAQYQPGNFSSENVAKAHEAIDWYKRILAQDSQNDEAFRAIAYLYATLKEDELLRGLLFQRAVDPTFPDEKRAEAFVVLASKDWDCSFKITELPGNRITLKARGRSVTTRYTKPKDPREFEKAQRCANEGLDLIDAAINLTPGTETTWAYKANLLLELAKLAEMTGDALLKTEYGNQAQAAQRTTAEIRNRKVERPATTP